MATLPVRGGVSMWRVLTRVIFSVLSPGIIADNAVVRR